MSPQLKFFAAFFLAVCSMQALAETASLPMAVCPSKDGQSCGFTNLQKWENGAGLGAYFYCDSLPSSTEYYMRNHFSYITGFNQDGQLQGSAADLKKYAFGAFADSRFPFPVPNAYVNVTDQNGARLVCHPGTGGRPYIIAGPPQIAVPHQVNHIKALEI